MGPGRGDTPSAPSFAVRLDWIRSVYGTYIGWNGLHIVDLDADGSNEVVSASSAHGSEPNTFWTVIRKDGSGYEHKWVSPIFANGIYGLSCLKVVQYDSDPALEVIVCSGTVITIYDGKALTVQRVIDTGVGEVRSLEYEDVDSDGVKEFVFVASWSPTNLCVVDSVTGALEYTGVNLGGRDIAVGNFDEDPDIEIAVAREGSPGRIINGKSHAIEWSYAPGFGRLTRAAQLDEDPALELIVVGFDGWIRVFDVELAALKYQVGGGGSFYDGMRPIDVEGDGPVEIVSCSGYTIFVTNGQTGAIKWSMNIPLPGNATDFACGDIDGDGIRELVFGDGHNSSDADSLVVVNTQTRAIVWRSHDYSGPFYGLDYGDLDLDGTNEIVLGSFSSDGEHEDGLYIVHDSKTKKTEFVSPPVSGDAAFRLWRIRNAQVDADPQPEIFATTSTHYAGRIVCFDGLTHVEQFRTVPLTGQAVTGMQISDIDLDGLLEIVASVQKGTSGAPGTFVYVYDARTGALEWVSPQVGTNNANLLLLRVGNVDSDVNPEIVVAQYQGAVIVIDGVTHIREMESQDYDVTALEVKNIQGSSTAEIIVGNEFGDLFLVNPLSGLVQQTLGFYGARINGLAFAQVGGTSDLDAIFCSGGRLRVRYATGAGVVNWFSEVLEPKLGEQDGLLAADIDGDGVIEVMIGGDSRAYLYKMGAGAVPFPGLGRR